MVSCWAFCLAGMYEGEAFMGICATAAVVDPLELGCYFSYPSPEICLSEEQQSLFWPKKGTDSSEVGTLLIQPQEYVTVSIWPHWALCCLRYLDFHLDFPIGVLSLQQLL